MAGTSPPPGSSLGTCLELTGLTVRYGDYPRRRHLDLRPLAGETVALFGPNRAGKSTVVNAVLGLIRVLLAEDQTLLRGALRALLELEEDIEERWDSAAG